MNYVLEIGELEFDEKQSPEKQFPYKELKFTGKLTPETMHDLKFCDEGSYEILMFNTYRKMFDIAMSAMKANPSSKITVTDLTNIQRILVDGHVNFSIIEDYKIDIGNVSLTSSYGQ